MCWSHKAKIDYHCSWTGVLWFIYVLIGIRILFKINKKITKENDIFLFIVIIFETYIGYIMGIKGYWLPWSLDITFACMFFYYIGYIFNKYEVLGNICKEYKILILVFILWVLGIKYNWIEIAVRRYSNGLWSYVTAISGTIIILKISMLIESKHAILTKFLSWCGKNSLYILFGHYIEIELIKYNITIKNKQLCELMLMLYKCLTSMIVAFFLLNFRKLFNKRPEKVLPTENNNKKLK